MTTENNDEANWVTVETCVRNNIAVEVRRKDNYVMGNPPLYSLRVGRARIADDGTVWISPHMSVYDLHVACELIDEVGERYRALRTNLQLTQRVVERKNSPRMGMSRDGQLESVPRKTHGGRVYRHDTGED